MRAHGTIDAGTGLGHDGHACWGFDDRQEFIGATFEFFTDGLRIGQRLVYVGSEPVAEQRERLDPLGDVGYSGLRVAAQATDLVADPETWDAHVCWESTADRVLSTRSLSALCGYERAALPPQLLADLAAIHPAANSCAGPAPFHLFGEDGGLALTGEVDLFSSETLDRVLGVGCDGDEPISLDLAELDFIDHQGVEILAAHVSHAASASGCTVQHEPHIVRRLCEILELRL